MRLTAFDAWTVIIASAFATVFMAVRRARGIDHEARQWLDDALNVGTLVVLAALVAASFPWWTFQVTPNPVTDIALIYCGVLIWTPVYNSLRKR
jgi:hypothetical protein